MKQLSNLYMGVIEDNYDPLQIGRIKVRISTLHDNIPLEYIPYSSPFGNLSGTAFQVPDIGKLVNVLFLSDDIYSSYYIYSENYNGNLQNQLNELQTDSYSNFSSLLMDQSTQIYVKDGTLTIDQLLNKITIDDSSINLELKDNLQLLTLGIQNADQEAVLGTNFFAWMDTFIEELMKPGSLMSKMGPVIKTKLDIICSKYIAQRSTFVSNRVYIVDNGEVKLLKREIDTINNGNDIGLNMAGGYSDDLLRNIADQNDENCYELSNASPSTYIFPKPNPTTELSITFSGASMEHSEFKISDKPPAVFGEILPVLGTRVSSRFGLRNISVGSKNHKGIDIAAPTGTNIICPYDGKIIKAYYDSVHKGGNSIVIKHNNGFTTGYCHLSKILVKEGDNVKAKEIIGLVGNTGVGTGPHLHFTVRKKTLLGSDPINPELYFKWPDRPGDNPKNKINSNGRTSTITQDTYGNNISEPCPDMSSFNYTQTPDDNLGSDIRNYNLTEKEQKAMMILNLVAKAEGTKNAKRERNGDGTPYTVTYKYGKYLPKYVPGSSYKSVQPITKLTIKEIQLVQKEMSKLSKADGAIPSHPVGRYQFMSDTLNGLLSTNKNITKDSLFSPETQDKLAIQRLLYDRGFNKWLDGKISDNKMQLNLSQEWASFPKPGTNQSYYGGQHAQIKDKEVKDLLKSIKNS